jgi:hypothetical protein
MDKRDSSRHRARVEGPGSSPPTSPAYLSRRERARDLGAVSLYRGLDDSRCDHDPVEAGLPRSWTSRSERGTSAQRTGRSTSWPRSSAFAVRRGGARWLTEEPPRYHRHRGDRCWHRGTKFGDPIRLWRWSDAGTVWPVGDLGYYCPRCGALAGTRCHDEWGYLDEPHSERTEGRGAAEVARHIGLNKSKGKRRKPKRRSVRTVPGGGFETKRRRH